MRYSLKIENAGNVKNATVFLKLFFNSVNFLFRYSVICVKKNKFSLNFSKLEINLLKPEYFFLLKE